MYREENGVDMFEDFEKNKEMIIGSYHKFKSYYHYNKSILFMKKKIAEFENDSEEMEKTISLLAQIIKNPSLYEEKINYWINSVSYYILPKAFESNEVSNIVSSSLYLNQKISRVNFFIDMPIELHILDTLWTTMIGKLVYDKNVLKPCCYGNCIDYYVVYNGSDDFIESINFGKRNLFKIYYYQYCKWKGDVIESAKKHTDTNTAMVSLDIRNFYYSVCWKFDDLYNIIDEREMLDMLAQLTSIMTEIYKKYTMKIAEVRQIIQDYRRGESVLPIGLFSSMLIANIYLSKYDNKICEQKNVLHYGRYVDDIMILLDLGDDKLEGVKGEFDHYLVEANSVIEKGVGGYNLNGENTLMIQSDKVKMVFLEKQKSKVLLKKLEKTIHYPSQMDVIPKDELRLEDFEETAYVIRGFNEQSKLREVSNIEIDGFHLARHISYLVKMAKYMDINLDNTDRAYLQDEGQKILNFFKGSNAVKYCNNWINGFYFFLLLDEKPQRWDSYKRCIEEAIDNIKIGSIEDVHSGENNNIKKAMKRDLYEMLQISMSTSLALNPYYNKKVSEDVLELAISLRRCNLFNHLLVAIPLINYYDELPDDIDLTSENNEWEVYKKKKIAKSNNKIRFSPRFIHFDELFHYVYWRGVLQTENYFADKEDTSAKEKINNIMEFFFEANQIHVSENNGFDLEVVNETYDGRYNLQRIKLGDEKPSLLKIAIANVKIDLDRAMLGLPLYNGAKVSRRDFWNFLQKSFDERVDYILLPEFYLPLKWIPDVLSYVRKTGITIIAGLQYMLSYHVAHNNVAVFASLKSGKSNKYRNACMFLREKNDYAPMEKEILALNGCYCKDQERPCYQIFQQNGIKYGLFLCYEFTDIVARALYKNEVDIIFAPENNKDTSYFSSIIESMTRDIHAFIVQANTSIYGDSRITGPFSRDIRNIVQIKGGENDELIIGTIDIPKVKMHRAEERRERDDKIKRNYAMPEYERREELKKIVESKITVSKTSARFREHD